MHSYQFYQDTVMSIVTSLIMPDIQHTCSKLSEKTLDFFIYSKFAKTILSQHYFSRRMILPNCCINVISEAHRPICI